MKKEMNKKVLKYVIIVKGKKKDIAQCGARTHDPEIKSLVLYRLS